jgi:hypothetical protein
MPAQATGVFLIWWGDMPANRLPAFQFYTADWSKDPGVQALSYHERGDWFVIICLMHESDQRWRITLYGKQMPEEALARLLGLDKQILTTTLTSLLEYGVASRDEDGIIISRRMVRDEEIRIIRARCGKLGGNPNLLVNQKPTTRVKQIPTPSSSSSSSSSSSVSTSKEDPPLPPKWGPWIGRDDFLSAWKAWEKARKKKAGERQYRQLEKLAGGDAETAVSILNQSADNQWIGLFALKGAQNGVSTKHNPGAHRAERATREYPEPDLRSRILA